MGGSEGVGGNLHGDFSCEGGIDGREVCADGMRSVENLLSTFSLVGLLSGLIPLAVSVSCELSSFCLSVGGEAEF